MLKAPLEGMQRATEEKGNKGKNLGGFLENVSRPTR